VRALLSILRTRGALVPAVALAIVLAAVALRPTWIATGAEPALTRMAGTIEQVELSAVPARVAPTIAHALTDSAPRERVRTGTRTGLLLIALLAVLAGFGTTRPTCPAVLAARGAPRRARITLPPRRGPPAV
jgi:hypothetical protein